MRYAERECAGCHRVFPAYELAEVSDRVETGYSRHERRIGHTPNFRHTGTTRHFSNRVRRLCFSCRVKRFVGKVVVAAGGGLLFIAFANHGGSSPPSNSKTSSASGVNETGQATSTSSDGINADREASSEAGNGAQPALPEPEPAQPSVPVEPSSHADAIIADPTSNEEIVLAIEQAAATGKASRWKVRGLKGYAVPSAAGSDGCRMVQVSIDDGAQAAPLRRCPESGAEARP